MFRQEWLSKNKNLFYTSVTWTVCLVLSITMQQPIDNVSEQRSIFFFYLNKLIQ